jgi:hypothetical protein
MRLLAERVGRDRPAGKLHGLQQIAGLLQAGRQLLQRAQMGLG